MSNFLKGNYELKKRPAKIQTRKRAKPKLTEQLEENALARLGGSMCFVIKGKTFMWNGDDGEASSE